MSIEGAAGYGAATAVGSDAQAGPAEGYIVCVSGQS